MQPENLGFVLRQRSVIFIVIIGKLSQSRQFVNMLIQLFIHQCAKRNTCEFLMRSIVLPSRLFGRTGRGLASSAIEIMRCNRVISGANEECRYS